MKATKSLVALFLAALILILPGMPAFVKAAADSDFVVSQRGGGISIDGYTGPGGAVSIPNTINGKTVRFIGAGAFKDFEGITGVSIPSGVTQIDAEAFYNCVNMHSVKLNIH